LTAAARETLRREERLVIGAQPPLGAGNQELRNRLSSSRVSSGQVSNAIADDISIEEIEVAGAVAVNPPPRQGRASSRGSGGGGRVRTRIRQGTQDAVLIGDDRIYILEFGIIDSSCSSALILRACAKHI
jgi:hypothetical protein